MKVTRQQLQKIVNQEYKKLLREGMIGDMEDADSSMNMFGAGYEASDSDEEHVHDDSCGHLDTDTDSGEHDDESRMFRSHLTSISKQIQELENMVQQGDNVEEWMQEKMAVAASMVDSIYHYLSHGDEDTEEMDDEYDDEMEMDDDEIEDDEYDDEMDDEIEDDEYEEEVEDDENDEYDYDEDDEEDEW